MVREVIALCGRSSDDPLAEGNCSGVNQCGKEAVAVIEVTEAERARFLSKKYSSISSGFVFCRDAPAGRLYDDVCTALRLVGARPVMLLVHLRACMVREVIVLCGR